MQKKNLQVYQTWSEVLDSAAKKYKILSWGREIEAGRQYGILRFSTCYMQAKHIGAITYAITLGCQCLSELSIHFTCSYPPNQAEDFINPFSQDGEPLPAQCVFYGAKQVKTGVFDRLGGGRSKGAKDMYPKDSATVQVKGDKSEEQKVKLFKTTVQNLIIKATGLFYKMENVKVLGLYNLKEWPFVNARALDSLGTGIQKLLTTECRLEGLILSNCNVAQQDLKKLFETLSSCLSLRLLALSALELDDAVAKPLCAMITAHRNGRDQKFWQHQLKDFNQQVIPENKAQPHFTRAELDQFRFKCELKGLTYLDISNNQLGNKFCEELSQCLRNDGYVHTLDLSGNSRIDLNTRFLHSLEFMDRSYDIAQFVPDQNVDDVSEYKEAGQYLPLGLALSADISAKYDHFSTLNPFERYVLKLIAPNFYKVPQVPTIQLFAKHASSASELDLMLQTKAHPLADLLLQNTTIIYLALDDSVSFCLRKFVNFRLQLNLKAMQQLLLKQVGKQLTNIEKQELQQQMDYNSRDLHVLQELVGRRKPVRSHSRQIAGGAKYRGPVAERPGDNYTLPARRCLSARQENQRLKPLFGREMPAIMKTADKLNSGEQKIKAAKSPNASRGPSAQRNLKLSQVRSVSGTRITESRAGSAVKLGHSQLNDFEGAKDIRTKIQILQQQIKKSQSEMQHLQQSLSRAASKSSQGNSRATSRPKSAKRSGSAKKTIPREPEQESGVQQVQKSLLKSNQLVNQSSNLNSRASSANKSMNRSSNEPRKLKQSKQDELFDLQPVRSGKSSYKPKPLVDEPAYLSKNNSQDELARSKMLFDTVLDSAYNVLMQLANGNKRRALQLFNEYQDEILEDCESVIQQIDKQKLSEDDIERLLSAKLGRLV